MNSRLLQEMHQILQGSIFGPEDRPNFVIPPATPPRVDPQSSESLSLVQRALGQALRGLEAIDVEMAVGGGASLASAPSDTPSGKALRTKYAKLERRAFRAKRELKAMLILARGMERDLGDLIQSEWGGVVIPGK